MYTSNFFVKKKQQTDWFTAQNTKKTSVRFTGTAILLVLFLMLFQPVNAQQAQIDEYKAKAEESINAGNKNQAANYLSKIALLYWDKENYTLAVDYFLESAEFNREVGNLNGVKSIYFNIGTIYSDANQYAQALDYFRKSLQIAQQLGKKRDVASTLIQISTVQETQRKYTEAIETLQKAQDIAAELNDIRLMRSCYGFLAQNYKRTGNMAAYEEAFNNYTVYDKKLNEEALREHERESDERVREISELAEAELSEKELELRRTEDSLQQIEEMNRQKEMEIELLMKEQALQNLQLKEKEAMLAKEAIQKRFYIVGISLVGLILLLTIIGIRKQRKANKKLEQQNHEIQVQNMEIAAQRDNIEKKSSELGEAFEQIKKQNLDITNSINYAKRIQQAMMPGEQALQQFLPESFIILKPRNIVSGDFYWFTEAESMGAITSTSNLDEHGKEIEMKKLAVAAIDCTGHGVPGAFMSMIGFNLLNEIAGLGIKRANGVLNKLHRNIRLALRQDTTDNRDGMDVAACVIDKANNTIDFAGAKNPLVYIQNNELNVIKGDKLPVGGFQREGKRKFTNHRFTFDSPITCYIFSDGYQDQFGGDKGRKFMKKKLYKLLHEIHQKPMAEQKEILNQAYNEWKGDRKQIDDVLIIGFRVYPKKQEQEQKQ